MYYFIVYSAAGSLVLYVGLLIGYVSGQRRAVIKGSIFWNGVAYSVKRRVPSSNATPDLDDAGLRRDVRSIIKNDFAAGNYDAYVERASMRNNQRKGQAST